MIKDVMVRLDGTKADEVRMAAVEQIADHFDSHVVGLFLNVLPMRVPIGYDSTTGSQSVTLVERARASGNEIEDKLRQRLARLQKPVVLRRFDTFTDIMGEIAAREARTADVFVAVKPNGSREPEHLIENVLLGSGRHLVLVPEHMIEPLSFRHIFIAWNGSREATRAVSEALPYLRKADTVSIVIVHGDEPAEEQSTLGKNLVEHLRHHGIAGAVYRVRRAGHIGSTLLEESKRLKPDMIVMGSYGHSRLREWLLGGATYEMLHNAPVPLLIAH